MSILISPNLVLGDAGNPTDTPCIGEDNRITVANASATSEDAAHPISNVANPLTYNYWQAADSSPQVTQYLDFAIAATDDVDFLGIAGHNLGSAQCPVTIYGYTQLIGSPLQPDYFELVPEAMLGSDVPALFRYDPQGLLGIRVKIGAGTELPRVAVVYAGKLIVFPRGVHAPHVPITLGLELDTFNGISHNGQYLGEIITGKANRTNFGVRFLPNQFVRDQVAPFLARRRAFFFAWAPEAFPADVGYCWLARGQAPRPEYDWASRTFELNMALEGYAR